MNRDERLTISQKLSDLYPDKYEDEELTDLVDRVSSYSVAEVFKAIDEHRNTAKFKPSPAELLSICRRIRASSAASWEISEDKPRPSFAEIIRAQNERLRGHNDAYVLWCYYRGMWKRGRMEVLGRFSGYEAKYKQEIDEELKRNSERWTGELARQLGAHGYDSDESERVAAWVNADDVRAIVEYLGQGQLAMEVATR